MNLESTRSGPHPALTPHGAVKPALRTEAGEGSRRFDDAMQLLESGCWQASFLSLFDGDHGKCEELDRRGGVVGSLESSNSIENAARR